MPTCVMMDMRTNMAKHCGSCIHWRDVLTGWCDFYSWPMDADDDEPCKAYEAISESENYVPVMVDELVKLEDNLMEGKAMRVEKGNVKWMVYDEYEGEILWATTKEEAMKLAQKMLDSYTDYGEVIPDQVMYGGIVVAKVVAESAFKETDRQSNYANPDDWPYDGWIEVVGDLYMQEVD